jgi:ubiquinone/menaquinone biosynthesis C-methylase UbiE
MTIDPLSWEEAVRSYRSRPGNEIEVRNNYFDLPVLEAAKRYAGSEEFMEVRRHLGPGQGRRLLDVGAGNGIASYALTLNGWRVTALEPDPSREVGTGAIAELVDQTQLPIEIVQNIGEQLPFADASFDAVHARQVLHHAGDLDLMIREIARVLIPGSICLSTREHVADNEAQLVAFRNEHPLHRLYGGENAYPLSKYLESFQRGGFQVQEVWGPLESVLNFFPGTEAQRQRALRQVANHSYFRFGRLLSWSARFRQAAVRRYTHSDQTPGRIYSFLAVKI